jgi:hypothetical protein
MNSFTSYSEGLLYNIGIYGLTVIVEIASEFKRFRYKIVQNSIKSVLLIGYEIEIAYFSLKKKKVIFAGKHPKTVLEWEGFMSFWLQH